MVKTHIMDHVAGIEELGNSEVNIALGGNPGAVRRELVGIVEDEVLSTIRAVVVQPVRAALPILMSENVITNGSRVVDDGASGDALVAPWVLRSGERVPAKRRCNLIIGRDLKGAVTANRVVHSPLPNIVAACDLLRRDAGIRRPIEDLDDAGGVRCRDGSLVPVLFR
jgi:hypothetical protein